MIHVAGARPYWFGLALALVATGCPSSTPPESCTDGVMNGTETAPDCGGTCVPCGVGAACNIAKDCLSLVCGAGICVLPAAPTCSDGVHNGIETDVDCGGGCPKCNDGRLCAAWTDCQSAVCSSSRCTPPSCSDSTKNGGETDIDCGGGGCAACADLKLCAGPSDCQSAICAASAQSQSLRCMVPTCVDRAANGNESDVDCGGSCSACPAGKSCGSRRDCESTVCTAATFVCAAPTCSDGSKNALETDVDCGSTCAACDNGKLCVAAKDCKSLVCTGGRCVAPSCSDGVKNNGEIDVDCSGPCGACADGKLCTAAKDCNSAVCAPSGRCAVPTCGDGVTNGAETDLDCGGTCAACGDGKSCALDNDCKARLCGAGLRCSAVTPLVAMPETAIAARPSVLDAAGTLHSVLAVGNRLVHQRRTAAGMTEATIATFAAPELPFHPFFNRTGGAMYRIAINEAGTIFLLFATNRGPAARDSNVPYLTTYSAAGGWTTPFDLRSKGLFTKVNAEFHEGFDLAVDSQNTLHVLAAFFTYGNGPGFGFLDYYRWDANASGLLGASRLHNTAAGRPTLFIDPDDHLHVVYDDYQTSTPIAYRTSIDRGLNWSAASPVALRMGSGDRTLGLAVVTQAGIKRRFVSRRNTGGQLEVLGSSDGSSFAPVFTSNEPVDHESATLVPIGAQLHAYFVGPPRAGARAQLGRVIMNDTGTFGALEHLEETAAFQVSTYGIAGSTWPMFNRPVAVNLLKHWTNTATSFVLISRY